MPTYELDGSERPFDDCDCEWCNEVRAMHQMRAGNVATMTRPQPSRESRNIRDAMAFLRELRSNRGYTESLDRLLRNAWDESGTRDATRFVEVVEEVTGRTLDECANCDRPTCNTVDVDGGDVVCNSCRERYYGWCGDCEVYYHFDRDADEHEHTHGPSSCEADHQNFSLPRPNALPLESDTRERVTCAGGRIEATAFGEVCAYLSDLPWQTYSDTRDSLYSFFSNHVYYGDREAWSTWQTPEGNWTKRLNKLALQNNVKIPAEVMSGIGNIVRRRTSQPRDIHVEITRNLNQSASYFYHSDSCWFGSEWESMCLLKQTGGFAIRTFDGGTLSGRAWVLPLFSRADGYGYKSTSDCHDADAYMLFNPYGIDGYEFARIFADMVGMTYKRVEFCLGDAYINGARGYLISSAAACAKTDAVRLAPYRECSC